MDDNAISDSEVPRSSDIPLINFYPSEERDDVNHDDQNEDIDDSQLSNLIANANQQPYNHLGNKNSQKTERIKMKQKLCAVNIAGETESCDE